MSHKSKPGKVKAAANRQHPEPPPRELVVRTPAERWVRWLLPLVIAFSTFAAFLPALQDQFVGWDDAENFLENPHYRGLGWIQLRWMWTTHLGHYVPLPARGGGGVRSGPLAGARALSEWSADCPRPRA